MYRFSGPVIFPVLVLPQAGNPTRNLVLHGVDLGKNIN
jgi:hypothetical protein